MVQPLKPRQHELENPLLPSSPAYRALCLQIPAAAPPGRRLELVASARIRGQQRLLRTSTDIDPVRSPTQKGQVPKIAGCPGAMR